MYSKRASSLAQNLFNLFLKLSIETAVITCVGTWEAVPEINDPNCKVVFA